MTMKVTEHTIVTEVKRHPNDVRYPCRGTHEIMDAGRKLITSLDLEERKEMLKGTLILDEEETAELFDSVEVKDIIGLGIFRGKESDTPGFTSVMYEVEKIHKDNDFMECKNCITQVSEEISFQDFSIGLAMNLAEILYRDEKPFGAPTEQSWTVNIHEEVKDEEESEDAKVPNDGSGSAGSEDESAAVADTTAPSLPEDNKAHSGDDRKGVAKDGESDENDSTAAQPPEEVQLPTVEKTVLPGPNTVDITLDKEAPVEDPMAPLIWPACYHAFGFLDDSNTYCVIVNFRTTWDETKTLDLDGREEAICEKLLLEKISEGVYGYTHLYNETQLRQIFKSFRCDEVPYMTDLINN